MGAAIGDSERVRSVDDGSDVLWIQSEEGRAEELTLRSAASEIDHGVDDVLVLSSGRFGHDCLTYCCVSACRFTPCTTRSLIGPPRVICIVSEQRGRFVDLRAERLTHVWPELGDAFLSRSRRLRGSKQGSCRRDSTPPG